MILTDLQIPLGRFEGCITLNQNTQPTDLYPIGFVVLLLAKEYNILCFLLTAADRHSDAWGYILNYSCLGADRCLQELADIDLINRHNIRKLFIDCGEGNKDWLGNIAAYIESYFLVMLGEKDLKDCLRKERLPLSSTGKTLCFELLERWTKL
ncbi:hypothetical protein EOM71_03010 [Candidatus Falkowbacteria bacterium]|nr:hypothetical protein [Candidatus Falkowbacteria bacterium]